MKRSQLICINESEKNKESKSKYKQMKNYISKKGDKIK